MSPHHRPPRPKRRTRPNAGFSLIELLVVIGIIALLTAALVVGLSGASDATRERGTQVTLEKMRTLTDEIERSAGTKFTGITNGSVGARYGFLVGGVRYLAPVDADTLDPEVAGGDNAYFDTEAMRDTLAIMLSLQGVPANVEILSNLDSAERLPAPVDIADSTAIDGLINDSSLADALVNKFVVVTDAWGFPIIYCPGTGDPANIGDPAVVGDAGGLTGLNTDSATGITVIAANGKGFWVSPGPDGLYQTHGDNVYSTEVKQEPVN